MDERTPGAVSYRRFLLLIAGMGGLLYGVDVGIIAAALLYLSKTINLTVAETSIIVAAVLGGSMASSLVAGLFADWFGRKTMMIVSGLMFVLSVGLIVISQGFGSLLMGRLLQGMSGGVIGVVVPLYLAECLPAGERGRGTAIFQFMLTVGIAIAALTGWFYTREAETAIAAARGNAALITTIANHAWRGMFFAVIYPGIIFFLCSFGLSETPRWLFRRGRKAQALAALRRSASEREAQNEMRAMEALVIEKHQADLSHPSGSLLQRKYVVPFFLACAVLSLTQATGINSVLGYLVIILKQAGMTAHSATQGDVAVKVLNCLMTVVAIALVDRKGRKFLLKVGTGGIVLALLAGGLLFLRFESKDIDVKAQVEAARRANTLNLSVDQGALGPAIQGRPMALSVLYSYGSGDKVAVAQSNSKASSLRIEPDAQSAGRPLVIKRALYGPVPTERTGWLIAACLSLYIASYAVGPGVVVWLALSELMPTRIRSIGMGIALLLNQGVSTLIAGLFLPIVEFHGYATMFFFWAGCSVVYFLTATFLLPETKGKTLEEIERYFEGGRPAPAAERL